MSNISIEQAKVIYRQAIDPAASDSEGEIWWQEVVGELCAVLSARTMREAAAVIDWWHDDWRMVGDSSLNAARRLREVAKSLRT